MRLCRHLGHELTPLAVPEEHVGAVARGGKLVRLARVEGQAVHVIGVALDDGLGDGTADLPDLTPEAAAREEVMPVLIQSLSEFIEPSMSQY